MEELEGEMRLGKVLSTSRHCRCDAENPAKNKGHLGPQVISEEGPDVKHMNRASTRGKGRWEKLEKSSSDHEGKGYKQGNGDCPDWGRRNCTWRRESSTPATKGNKSCA